MSCPFSAIQNAQERQRISESSIPKRQGVVCPFSGREGTNAHLKDDFDGITNDYEREENKYGFSPALHNLDRSGALGAIIEDEHEFELDVGYLDQGTQREETQMTGADEALHGSPRPPTISSTIRSASRDPAEYRGSEPSVSMNGSMAGIDVRMSGSRY